MSKMGKLESDSNFDEVTIIRKHAPPVKTLKSQSELNAATRRGEAVETSKKFFAGSNRQHKGDKNTARLDDETEELHHDKVTLQLGQVLQQARAAKEWTQKDLSTRINEKPEVVKEYENGKAIPNQQVLNKLERTLGVKLRGKDIGTATMFEMPCQLKFANKAVEILDQGQPLAPPPKKK